MIAEHEFELHVEYGQITLCSGFRDFDEHLTVARAGQRNGICGAYYEHSLSLLTGLHTGAVPFRVEVHDAEPVTGNEWEEVVEVNYRPSDLEQNLWTFSGGETVDLAMLGDHRARYSARGMGRAHDLTRLSGEPIMDRYLLQLWPAESQPERVIRETSEVARYWAGVAQRTPPPTNEDRFAAAAQWLDEEERRQEHERQHRHEAQQERERLDWGGTVPTPELEVAGWNARSLAQQDRELADLLVTAPEPVQRDLLRWLLEHGVQNVEAELDWPSVIDAAVARALSEADLERIDRALFGPAKGRRFVVVRRSAGATDPIDRPALWPPAAVYGALAATAEPDSMSRVLVDAVTNFIATDDPAVGASAIKQRLIELLAR